MLKSLSLTLVALSSYVLSLPVVCNTLMANENRVANAVSENANVLDELLEVPEFREAYLNGDYDADPGVDEFDVLYAVESGYSVSSKYYLYLYVWNKSGNGSDVYNFSNRYNAAEFYSFATYKSFSMDMQFVNRSNDYRFIKYRINNVSENNFLNSESGRREYGIKGIEIAHFEGNLQKFKEYPVAKKWNFEGETTDLFVTHNSSFEYLQLDLGAGTFPFGQYTDFYSGAYSLGGDYTVRRQQNLYYVYFNIPKSYKNSGSLYSIHADYYDFDLSNKIAFLLDEHEQEYYIQKYDIFDKLLKNGETLFGNDLLRENAYNYIFHAYFDQYVNARLQTNQITDTYVRTNDKTFHIGPYNDSMWVLVDTAYFTSFQWDYSAPDFLNQYRLLIPISSLTSDVSGHLISNYFDRLTAERVSGQLSSEVYKEIHYCNPGTGRDDSDAIETGWDLVSEASSHWSIWSWWHQAAETINVSNLKCIEHIEYNDKNISDVEFKNKYYIHNDDIPSIKNTLSSNDDTYVFRFKLDNSSSIELDYCDSNTADTTVNEPRQRIGFVSNEYHGVVDFDVLDLTFVNEDDELETIPVVSDPVNVFPDVPSPIRPSTGCGGFWKTLLMILMIIVLVVLILLFLKWFIPWKRNRQLIHAIKSSGKSSSNHSAVNHYNYNIKKTYINRPKSKKKKRRK